MEVSRSFAIDFQAAACLQEGNLVRANEPRGGAGKKCSMAVKEQSLSGKPICTASEEYNM